MAAESAPVLGGAAGSSDFLCHKGVANGLLLATTAALQAYKAALLPHGAYDPFVVPARLAMIDAKCIELTARAADPHLTGGAALAIALNAFWEVQDDRASIAEHIDALTTKAVADTMQASETTGKRARNWHIAAGASDPASIGECYRANSIEVVFGLDSRAYLDFINAVLGEMNRHRQAGYISVRFTRKSDALVSMHNVAHDVACSIEISSLRGLAGNGNWMRWLEDTATRMGGRPHWGQQNRLTHEQIGRLYPSERLGKWRAQLARIVGMSQTFANAYTIQRGLEPVPGELAATHLWAMQFNPQARGWDHVSAIAGHPFAADINCDMGAARFNQLGVKAIAAGDFDGDKLKELVVLPDPVGTGGNDLWVMKHNADARRWEHLSPIPGHPFVADLNCDAGAAAPTRFGAKAVAVGDFDGDGSDELVVVPDITGSAGNDLWAMKYDRGARTWNHMSPIPGHYFLADINCDARAPIPSAFGAKFVVAGDFDGDGQAEIVVVPEAPGTGGNDLWAMKFDRATKRWEHLSPLPGHPFSADINCDAGAAQPTGFGVKAVLAADVDGDGQQELIVLPDIGGTAGNDLWVMKFNRARKTWEHLSPNSAHGFLADLNCDAGAAAPTSFGVKLVVAGDFDGDGQAELIVAPDVPGTAGTDFWAMKFNRATRTWEHLSPIAGHPFAADINCDDHAPNPVGFGVKALLVADVDGDGQQELIVLPEVGGTGGNDLWALKFNRARKQWEHVSPIADHPFRADLNCDAAADTPTFGVKFGAAGNFVADRRDELILVPDFVPRPVFPTASLAGLVGHLPWSGT